MRFLLTGDLHIMGRTPRARLDDYTETLWKKMDEVISVSNRENVDAVLIPGDVFDYPYQSYPVFVETYYRLMNLEANATLIYAIFGQHDLFFQKLESAEDKTALGALSRMRAISILSSEPIEEIAQENIHLYGSSYGEPTPKVEDRNKINILVIHKMILPKKPWATAVEGKDYYLPRKLNDFDLVLCGDWHGDFVYKNGRTTVVNPGALMRKTGSDVDYNRKPQVAIWDSHTRDLELIPLKSAKPAEEVLTREHLEAKLKQTSWMKEFTDRLKGGTSIGPNYILNVLSQIEQLENEGLITAGTIDKINEAIENSAFRGMLNQEMLNEAKKITTKRTEIGRSGSKSGKRSNFEIRLRDS